MQSQGEGFFWSDMHGANTGFLISGWGSNDVDSLSFQLLQYWPSGVDPVNRTLQYCGFGGGSSELFVNGVRIPQFGMSLSGPGAGLSRYDPVDGTWVQASAIAFIAIASIEYLPVPPGYPPIFEGYFSIVSFDPTLTEEEVPEPGTLALVSLGLAIVAWMQTRTHPAT